ncbi:MAG: ACP S-malonyltransferase [Deltaproteobacteria bacterium]|uniref:Malonyl CoA-acyl carrier protein transacylase n=1 Tax=Candidatus Zymogenus saltonus TaxID=2844893 RepID=A0A9D8KFL7_9DELT|nr:ACP S-malonyltransferase [Candidatus Zymogenus saltonus]
MGKDIYENFKSARLVFEEASDSLHIDLKRIVFEGPEDELNRTAITQPAVFTVSAAILYAMREAGVGSDVKVASTAGHSLGEYTSLFYGGAFDFQGGLSIVGKRGKIMEEAVSEEEGGMAAILGLDRDDVDKLVSEVFEANEQKENGLVVAANYNAPGQVVISGHRGAVAAAVELATERGAKKAVILKVGVPSHSPLMKGASEILAEELKDLELGNLDLPVISNVTAHPHPGGGETKDLLVKQLVSPVRWEESVKYMIDDGITDFIEIGPGRVLSGLVKRIDRKAGISSVGDLYSLKEVEKKYQ